MKHAQIFLKPLPQISLPTPAAVSSCLSDWSPSGKMSSFVMEIHREIWNNDILRPELPLSPVSAKFTQHHGCSKGNWLHIQTSQNLYKEVFHKKRDAWEKLRYERGVEILPCLSRSVRPLVSETFGQYIFPLQLDSIDSCHFIVVIVAPLIHLFQNGCTKSLYH